MKNSRIDHTLFGAIFALCIFLSMTVFFGGIFTESINAYYIEPPSEPTPQITDLNRTPDIMQELFKYRYDPDAAPLFEQEAESEEQPTPESDGEGIILRKTYVYSESSTVKRLDLGGYLRNDTEEDMDYLIDQTRREPRIEEVPHKAPLVLIMHTHTTECYHQGEPDSYSPSDPERSLDDSQTVVEVGRIIAQKLREGGIGVIHDETVHDYPEYNGAYDRSEVTVREYLEKYPTVQIVLDIHRDAIEADGIRYAPVANIDGKNAAQVMLIVGNVNVPNFRYNLRLASLWQSKMESLYPTLTRPMLVAERNYNQHLTYGSILVEMGASGNTPEEAKYAGELVGISLAQMINEMLR